MTYVVTRDGLKHEDELKEPDTAEMIPWLCDSCGAVWMAPALGDDIPACPECDPGPMADE